MIASKFKAALKSGQPQIGTFVKLANATAVEALGMAGLDFAIIDTEHAPCDQLALENIIRAADVVALPSIVRVAQASESSILKALDSGASGVQVPNLSTLEDVYKVVEFSKYSPKGKRGLSFSQRSAGYGTIDKQEYMSSSNEGLINVIHIENTSLAGQIEDICAIDDIDVLFIGPMDISQSMGHPGNPSHPDVARVVESIISICKKHNKPSGIFVSTPDDAKKYLELGVSYIALSSDLGFIISHYRQMKKQIL